MRFDTVERGQRGFRNAVPDTHLICSLFQQGLHIAMCHADIERIPLTLDF